jgi:ABC-type transport system involved in cytochrome c biogenesis permease subunit
VALPSQVTVDGHTYTIGLRNERIYKPYTITLTNFEHTKYAGTNTPKDFASTVRLLDPETGDDREVRIWMNHPLRHGGETFYQQSTVPGDTISGETKDTGTVLQVVKNPGWILPYISCCVVTLGMLIHFGLGIVAFTSKNAAKLMRGNLNLSHPVATKSQTTPETNRLETFKKYFPWVIVGVCGLYSVKMLFPKQETYKEFDLSAFGAIPVLDDGRVKPLDSLARTNMLFISGRSEFEDQAGNTQPAILWLLELMAADVPSKSAANDFPVFRIDNEQVLQLLELKHKPGSYRYSLNELRPRFDKFLVALDTARNLDDKKRELYHNKIIELSVKLRNYQLLAHRETPTLIPKEKGSDKWLTLFEIEKEVAQNPKFGDEAHSRAREEAFNDSRWKSKLHNIDNRPLAEQQELQQAMMADIEFRTEVNLQQIAVRERRTISPAAGAFGDIFQAYKVNRPNGFSDAIKNYTTEYVYPLNPEFPDTARFEQKMNQANPLIVAAFLFIFAAVFRIFSWLVWEKPLCQASWGLALISLVLMIATLLGRMYIMQRPLVFVTNLYSSALMIGTGLLTAGLIIERVYKNGLGLIVGSLAAASLVDIAHHLSTDGKDTLGALVAVLDTNYWLASHVTTVTLGYAATVFAGSLGASYIIWGLFGTNLTKEKHAVLGSMMYGVLCFATLLSFVGTVLGGIWADQSWGRFWGWDPKENGAVLIVIWNALNLHARWCGLVRQRGMAVLSVAGIMVTFWSYFGTNQLGAGLHNYGFNKTLADLCSYIWIICLIVIGLGLIPLKYWRSFSGTGLPRPESTLPSISTSGLGSSQANGQPQGKRSGKNQ